MLSPTIYNIDAIPKYIIRTYFSFQSVIGEGNLRRSRTEILLFSNEQAISMNGIFGDPSPGVSKRLYIHYKIGVGSDKLQLPTKLESTTSQSSTCLTWETIVASFAEHENRISLRCNYEFERKCKT
jgi:hypothetical protein